MEPNTPRQKRKKGKKRLATGGPVPLGRVGMERRIHGGGLPGLGARARRPMGTHPQAMAYEPADGTAALLP